MADCFRARCGCARSRRERELVTSLLLAPSDLQTASIFAWQAFEQGSIGDGMAMGVLTLLISGTLPGLAARGLQRFDQTL